MRTGCCCLKGWDGVPWPGNCFGRKSVAERKVEDGCGWLGGFVGRRVGRRFDLEEVADGVDTDAPGLLEYTPDGTRCWWMKEWERIEGFGRKFRVEVVGVGDEPSDLESEPGNSEDQPGDCEGNDQD